MCFTVQRHAISPFIDSLWWDVRIMAVAQIMAFGLDDCRGDGVLRRWRWLLWLNLSGDDYNSKWAHCESWRISQVTAPGGWRTAPTACGRLTTFFIQSYNNPDNHSVSKVMLTSRSIDCWWWGCQPVYLPNSYRYWASVLDSSGVTVIAFGGALSQRGS